MPKKGIALVALAVLALCVVTAPVLATGAQEGGDGTSYVRLAWWGNPTRDAKTEQAVAMYTEQNPGVEIELETVGWGGYWDRINTQAAAGSLPDLMQHDYSQIYDWVQRDLLLDLTPYIQSGAIETDDIASSFLDGGRFSGGIYGISLGTNSLTAVYDREVVRQAGVEIDPENWTWADFEEIALTIYEETGVKTMPIYTGDPRHGLENMLIQVGETIFAEDGNSLGFSNTDVVRQYFDIQLRLKAAGALIDPEVAFVSVTPDEGQLAQGNTWIEWIWSNQLASTQAPAPNYLEMALVPWLENAEQPGTYLKPSMFFSVTSQAENPDDAAGFLNFFVNDVAVNTEILTAERGVPIPSDVREALAANVDEVNQRVFAFIALAGDNASQIPLPDPEGAAEVVDLIRQTTIEVLMERISVDAGIDRIISEGNAILAD